MKILTIDNHWVCRAGLKPVLSQIDRNVSVLEAGSFDEAMKLVAGNKDIKLIVLDLLLPGLGSLDSIRELLDKLPQSALVVFSSAIPA